MSPYDDADRDDSEFADSLLGHGMDVGQPTDGSAAHLRRADRHRPAPPRGRKTIPLIAAVLVVILVLGGYVLVRRVADGLSTKDYKGAGTGSVVIEIKAGDSSSDIGSTLRSQDVVASKAAFVDAARASGRSEDLQAGFFKLRKRMSGAAAVELLLEPTSRVSNKVTIAEGLIVPEVLAVLAKALRIPVAQLQAAAKDIPNLGLPDGFIATNAEGFLFPQTYEFDPGVTASQALQTLTSQFEAEARTLNFAASAAKVKLTPYKALIVASMVEAESKFDQDRARVARVVYNRLSRGMALGFDTTTAYAYKLAGKDPTKATYKESSPYNTRINKGLPPTPIGNPGAKSMTAAIHPAAGNWLYFVSADAAGHLFFTNDPVAFEAASAKCLKNKWGCT